MWQNNAVLFVSTNGTTWNKWSDHNRSPLDISFQRVGEGVRMVDGTLRRTTVTKKRTFNIEWDNFPSKRNVAGAMGTVDDGWAGEEIEAFYNSQDNAFEIKLRKGSDVGKTAGDATIEKVKVMITEFNKTVLKRGPSVDLWSLSITLEEV